MSFDNLELTSEVEWALERLRSVADAAGCHDCREYRPCQGVALRNKESDWWNPTSNFQLIFADYDDIFGPDIPPRPGYCEEVVTGVAASMQVIATMAPNRMIRAALVGIIEALKVKCLKCCEAGEFWKACVAPIARKWKEWKSNKENHLPWDDWV